MADVSYERLVQIAQAAAGRDGVADSLDPPPRRSLAEKLAETWPARLARSAYDAVTLPGDVYAGRVTPQDPRYYERAVDLAGTLMSGAPATAVRGAAGVFGGRLAQTADHAALARAEAMTAAGESRKAIWRETGWFTDPADGRWKFYIPDEAMTVTPHGGIVHPDAVAAYPALGSMPTEVRVGPLEGRYWQGDPPKIRVTAPDVDALRNAGAHEIQHAIQDIEGTLPRGGAGPIDEARRAIDAGYPDWGATPNKLRYDAAREAYHRLRHEVEARNAGDWALMSSAERAKSAPWQTADVPVSKQITDYSPPEIERVIADLRAGGERYRQDGPGTQELEALLARASKGSAIPEWARDLVRGR
ncbi:hypothetical protein RHODGE_RHODGE_03322 [Rhodoplanes serenus]|uniref:Large polyvalent protein associated domain-containing protein n=1 Tax=Rhodoplanes serenus TaxID=200615 RepID=A0A3S4BXS2_9BRAD|nr:LPD23 domain-containing protein [Rhodoplanes serenus]VCU10136.1 hypothetical protein RHODGE_RHODGE_03322 [Rhodoplanes serenus]